MSIPNNNPLARRDSVSKRPALLPTRLSRRSSTSSLVTSPELVGTTMTATPATTTTITTTSVNTRIRPSVTFQPATTRLHTPPPDELARADTQPQTTTTTTHVTTTNTSSLAFNGSPGTTTVIVNGGNDSNFAPSPFWGTHCEDAGAWLRRFEKYAVYRGNNDTDKLHLMALLLQDAASNWYDGFGDDTMADWTALKDAFLQRFEDNRGSTLAQNQRATSACLRTVRECGR